MLKYIKDEKKLFGNLQSEEQKSLLLKIYEWVEETFDNGNIYSTDFFGYGSKERQRRFISVYTEYKEYFLFQLHYVDPEEVKSADFDYSINNKGKYVDIKSYSIKNEQDIEKLKKLIRLAYESVPLAKGNDISNKAFTYGETYFIYRIAPSFVTKGSGEAGITLNKKLDKYFSALPLSKSVNSIDIKAICPVIQCEETAKIGWFDKNRGNFHLQFKGEIKKWVLNTFKPGEYMKISINKERNDDIIIVEKYFSQTNAILKQDGKEVQVMPKSDSKKMQSIITKGLEDFIKFVTNKRFSFGNEMRRDEALTNYIFSLKTKPFVILSGISGTGKTKIAQFFAEFMCPDEEVEEAEMNTENGSVYKVPTYFIKYSRIVLKNSIAELIRTPITEKSNEINVRFDGQEGKCWFGYANSQNRAKQILFRGEIARYIKNNIKIDDYLRIYVDSEGEEETIVFEKINPEKKRVIQKSNRYAFIPVRPDWTDNRSLLGFYNPITESYQPTELLKLMIRAKEDMRNPYFVIFDEMNLAKVEYYFSDFLSCMESRRVDGNGGITSEKIILHDAEVELSYLDDDGKEYKIPNRIEIPLNIYFTGTVNVDETTYMFSPKVLDRANVIEFNEVDMESYKGIILNENKKADVTEIRGANKDFIDYFTDNGRYCSRLIEKSFSKGLEHYYDKLMELNGILKEYHMHFGYRVIDEILMYLSYGYDYYDTLMEIDLDIQILQKVLPKLNGNRKQLEMPLTRLLRYCFNVRYDNKEKMLSAEEKRIAFDFDYDALIVNQYEKEERLELIEPTEEQIREGMELLFPRSAKKLCRMINMLDRQGYTSFIE